jgi:hypothetical protein
MLADVVGLIPGIANNLWNTVPATPGFPGLPPTCHFATAYWCFLDAFARPPTADEVTKMMLPTVAVRDMLPHGTVLVRPVRRTKNPSVLTPGSVLVFVDEDGAAKHSCVATDARTVGGYNQVKYFAGPAVQLGYSTHNTNELKWRDSKGYNQVRAQHVWCELYAIPEDAAKNVVRQRVHPAH